MEHKRKLDDQEKKIAKELIRNPRKSDNQISIKTGIPLKTVNRKRKRLEAKGIIGYRAFIDQGPMGTQEYQAHQIYITHLKKGITRASFLEKVTSQDFLTQPYAKHIQHSYVGERDGQVSLILFIQSHKEEDIVEIFNADIARVLTEKFGEGAVDKIITYRLSKTLRSYFNYFPGENIENGKIKTEWTDDNIIIG